MSSDTDDTLPSHGASSFRRFGRLMGWVRAKLRGRGTDSSLGDALAEIIEDEDLTLGPQERALLRNLSRIDDLEVWDAMVPRAHIVAVEDTASLAEIVELMSDRYHSRLPVYNKTLDQVTGMVHIKDVLAATRTPAEFSLAGILRPVLFVAPTMGVLELLLEMRDTRIHMAIVVDEFGGTDGLVTIEDLVEKIVGNIEDEHDHTKAQEEEVIERPDGSLDVPGSMPIEEFEERVGRFTTDEEREDIDTLGGLVVELVGHVPRRGERSLHPSGTRFEVLDADDRRVKRLRVRPVVTHAAGEGR